MVDTTETQLIEIAVDDSAQVLPSVPKGTASNRLFFARTTRGPLLPEHGSRTRERKLMEYYWNDHNLLFRGAIAGLIKRIQSTPWELQGKPELVELYQKVLMQADFGRGWDSLISKIILDYSRQDAGAYIELIGAGDPMQPIPSAVVGLSVLPAYQCLPTGDPIFPVVFMDDDGKLHTMHHSRIIRLIDTPDGEAFARGFGECALSRGIAAVVRDIHMNRYIEQSLDDNPPPGFVLFRNITDNQLQNALAQMERERQTDTGGTWGRSVRLFGLHAETNPEVEFISYSTPPERFNLEQYKNITAKEIAMAIGLDIQDIWELTGGNIGSATQSEILHQKSQGKAIGRILRALERIFNQALPESLSFEFQWRDPDEDNDRATLAQTWVTIGQQLQTMGASNEVVMQLLANQVEAVRDVITDEAGELRLPDTPNEGGDDIVLPDIQQQPSDPDDVVEEDKALSTIQNQFRRRFQRVAGQAQRGELPPAAVRATLRGLLQEMGQRAYIDGLRDGQADDVTLNSRRRRDITSWRTQQAPFINRLADDLTLREFKDTELLARAEMWVNRALNPIYYMGLAEADDNAKYLWIVDPRKEHCKTCLALNGQVHKMKDYIRSGLLPQSPSLECKGYQCGCKLKRTEGKARGRIPGDRGGVLGILGRIASGIRRLFGA